MTDEQGGIVKTMEDGFGQEEVGPRLNDQRACPFSVTVPEDFGIGTAHPCFIPYLFSSRAFWLKD
jgi:hypothetical protein